MEVHGIMVGKGLKSHPLPPLPAIPACSRAGTSQFLSEFLAPDAFPVPCVPGFSRPSRIPRAGIILEENPEFCVSFPVWFFRFHLEFPSRGESSWEKGWEGSDWETFPVPNPQGGEFRGNSWKRGKIPQRESHPGEQIPEFLRLWHQFLVWEVFPGKLPPPEIGKSWGSLERAAYSHGELIGSKDSGVSLEWEQSPGSIRPGIFRE